jgi:hypothetical protein
VGTIYTPASFQLVLLVVALVIGVLFILTQQNTLRAIGTENRLIHPGLIWLQIIPLFGLIWQFFVVVKIAGSIKKELFSEQTDSILGFADADAVEASGKTPTLVIGVLYCTFTTAAVFLNFFISQGLIPLVSLIMLAGVVCWIIYWVNLSGWKKKLRQKNLATL